MKQNINKKAITIEYQFTSVDNPFFPKGIKECLKIEIIDGMAFFHFNDSKITKKFAKGQNKAETPTIYHERLKKAITKYPNKKKEEIRDFLLKFLKIQEKLSKIEEKNE